MNREFWARSGLVAALVLVVGGVIYARSELCNIVQLKPVLGLQQVRQAELIHYLVIYSGMEAPDPEAKSPREFYEQELKMLIEAGFPSVLAEVEPDRIVTRRYFASLMFILALKSSPDFARKYGALKDETQKLRALVKEGWLLSEKGRIYRDEIITVLCSHELQIKALMPELEISPAIITEGSIEAPMSPH